MSKPLVLIVDDEPDIRELLEITLSRMGLDTLSAADLGAARDHLKQNPDFKLCLTDMRLPDGSGLELVKEIGEQYPELPVAVITAYGSMDTAVQALKLGAFDFVSKPIDINVLRGLVKTSLKLNQPATSPAVRDSDATTKLLGHSKAIKQLRLMIQKLARSQAPVHISGESGTGKDLVANLIHAQSPRSSKPFIAINCGAVPSELMESEFFGHKKGSFTGAIADKQGLFQAAEGGTLFLDEVADLPLSMQVKLLRAIQEKSIRPLGEQREIPIDVRIISATHQNLTQLVQEERFRQDLYYRLNVIELVIPPLRARPDDIELLVDFLLDRISSNHGLSRPQLAPEALKMLMGYAFPGNVRELENILERAAALCENGLILAEDLHLLPAETRAAKSSPAHQLTPDTSLDAYLEEVERNLILSALDVTGWNRTAAARQLGISFRALRYKLEKLNLDKETD
jgi:two-component system response regulator PilR (NtrC family)